MTRVHRLSIRDSVCGGSRGGGTRGWGRGGGLWAALLLGGGLMALALAGCGGGGGEDRGTLSVALTDASGPYANVVVSITAVYAVPAEDAGEETGPGLPLVVAFDTPQVVDVLTLGFIQQVLGTASVPAGDYEQIRLVLAPNPATGEPVNYVTLSSDPTTKLPLDTPSGQQSGLKIPGKFTVQPGELTAVALDFDPSRAIVSAGASGKYLLKPTGIRIVTMADRLSTYGSLSGTVGPAEAWPTAMVSIMPAGTSVAVASGTVNPEDGSFRAFLPAGSYAVRVDATGYTSYDSATVPLFYTVTVGADTAVSAITLVAPTP